MSAPFDGFDSGDTAWMLTSSALVLLMTPGLALFYAGLVPHKSALNLLMQNIVAMGIITVQWFFWGYSLAFSGGSAVYGNLAKMFFLQTHLDGSHPNAPTIPEELYAIYQMMFAIITPALITGATAGRFRFRSYCLFVFAWVTVVYCPIAHMIWHNDGWLFKNGVLDFAGGIVVHATGGYSALAAAYMVGPRRDYDPKTHVNKPHSPVLVVIGAGLLWVGWFGFNGGSATSAGAQATTAFVNSQIAAGFAGVTWMIVDWLHTRKTTATGVSIGFIAGLAAVTPASGYITALPAMAIGILSSIIGIYAARVCRWLKVDDTLDVFAVHALAGSMGVLLTGVFADNSMTGFASADPAGGWINQHYEQLYVQLYALLFAVGWCVICTVILLWVIDRLPYFGLHAKEETELNGMDASYHGEHMQDYEDILEVLVKKHLNAKLSTIEMQTVNGGPVDPPLRIHYYNTGKEGLPKMSDDQKEHHSESDDTAPQHQHARSNVTETEIEINHNAA